MRIVKTNYQSGFETVYGMHSGSKQNISDGLFGGHEIIEPQIR